MTDEKQRWVYEQYSFYTEHLQRAAALIQDEDARKVTDYRYIKGHRFKETVLHFSGIMHDSTVRRKMKEGIASIANTLKILGVFERYEEEQ